MNFTKTFCKKPFLNSKHTKLSLNLSLNLTINCEFISKFNPLSFLRELKCYVNLRIFREKIFIKA
ncbi:hypothetical protein DMC01_06950 [Campylobacter troglodytis]|nr:hypothetical protein DMC01_06950 [Campylobacter troglodytis]